MIATRFILRFNVAVLSFAAACMASTAQTATVTPNWTQQSPATSPSVRYASATAYDAATGQVVLFGGYNSSSTNLGDTWTYSGTTWTQQSPATSPSARYISAMAYDAATGQVVLFGGYNTGSGALGDTWTYNGTTWTKHSPTASPSARYGSAMAYDAATGQLVLFGGYNGSTTLSDTWTYNGTTWTQQNPSSSPPARAQSAMAYDAATGQLVLFGGSGGGTLGDTWTYNGTTWTQQSPASSPPARYFSATAYDAATGQLVLFGGYSGSGYLGDTWTYNGTTWTQQSPASSPSIRDALTMAYDTATGQVLLFGGLGNSSYVGDTWTYQSGAAGIPTSAVGTAAAQTAVYFLIGTAGTLPALSNANVLTQGASGLDFTLGTGSTCTGALTAAQTCTVNVAFTPRYPGQRMGAVNLTNSSGTVLATALISGIGNGPLAATSPGLITTVAGNGNSCSHYSTTGCGNGGAATSATLNDANGVAVDAAGNVYIADFDDHMVRKVSAATGLITTVAGNGTQCAAPTGTCGDGTLATSATAELNYPIGLAVDGAGNLYIADANNNKIRKVTVSTGMISTVAGNGTTCSAATALCGDGGAATAANLHFPQDVRVDAAGNLYIADSSDNRIRYVSAGTGIITTLAGTGSACPSPTAATNPCGDNSLSTSSSVTLYFPTGIALDAAGNVYIADTVDFRIRKISAATGIITSVAGSGVACSGLVACGDGASATASTAKFGEPYGLAVDAAGNLYIGDEGVERIRKVSATGILSSVAGSYGECSNTTAATSPCGDGSSATSSTATLAQPWGVAVDGSGNLYIGDWSDNRIRKVSTAAAINFATPTTAGSTDTTDGTQTAALNNIGNLPLVLSGQTQSSSNFVLGNPLTGGCSSTGTIAVGDSCLIGATFTPQAGQSGLLTGNVATTSNSLNVSNTVTNTLLIGAPASNATNVAVNPVVTTAGTASVVMGFQYGYFGSVDLGTQTITVNGSTSGVGAVTCAYKNSHANCSFNYTGPALNTVGYAPIFVTVAFSSPYYAFGGTNYLYVNPVVSQGGGRIGLPVSGFVAGPVGGVKAGEPAPSMAAEPAPVAPVGYVAPAVFAAAPDVSDTSSDACRKQETAASKDAIACPKQ